MKKQTTLLSCPVCVQSMSSFRNDYDHWRCTSCDVVWEISKHQLESGNKVELP